MLTVQDLHKSYQVGKTTYEVLKGVSLKVDDGEFVAVMGPSGSGKTTLLNCISCYIPADSGKITLGDEELASLSEDSLAKVRNQQLGLCVPGLFAAGRPHRPGEHSAARHYRRKRHLPDRGSGGSTLRRVRHCRIGGKYPAEISGGEKQRTAVARALITTRC